MTAGAVVETSSPRSGRASGAGFRTDIQGLRAVAVGLVLAFHAGLSFVPGGYVGVDVFFVLSGFLITGLIVREVERTGRLDLRRFYARRIRRLLPAAALTTVGVGVLTVLFLPVTRWASIARDIVASTVYLVNWRFADQAVDYMGAEEPASPLQHFWSLAIEEQFYIVWPALVVALVLLTGRRAVRRSWLAAAITLVLVPSLVWSVVYTAADPGKAYFVTTTRAWELAAGALLAIGAERLGRSPLAVRAVAGWLGLALIAVAAVLITPETPFPGIAAALPVAGALLVIFSGLGDGRGAVRLLSVPVMQDVGALSYSLYLWHWPLVVVATAKWGSLEGELATSIGVLAVLASAVPAWFSYRAVEHPIHASPRLARSLKASFLVGLLAVLLGLGAAFFVSRSIPEVRQLDEGENPGAAALVRQGDGWRDPTQVSLDRVVPAPADAFDDFDWTCRTTDVDETEVDECRLFEDATGLRVAAVGDSHLQHWLPGIRHVAEKEGWQLTVYIKQGCPLIAFPIPREGVEYSSCVTWNAEVSARLAAEKPDLVVLSSIDRYAAYDDAGELLEGAEGFERIVEGYVAAWKPLLEAGSRVIAIRDTPAPGFSVPECLAAPGAGPQDCLVPEDVDLEKVGAGLREAVERSPGARLVDMNDLVCIGERCRPVVGGVLVYRDRNHLSMTYVDSLAPFFLERLVAALED